jgi:hypothetical protein
MHNFKALAAVEPDYMQGPNPAQSTIFYAGGCGNILCSKSQNVNNFAALLEGQLAQLVTDMLTRFCYHARNVAALVNS